MYKIIMTALVILCILPGKGLCSSAGELGIHYNIRYTNPIVVGPVKQIIQGDFPKSPIIEAEEDIAIEEGTLTPSTSLSSPAFNFLLNKDLDETIMLLADQNDIFSLLHVGGARASYRISPLVQVPLENAKGVGKANPRHNRQRR